MQKSTQFYLNRIIFIAIITCLLCPTVSFAYKAPNFFISNLEGKRFNSKKKSNILISLFFLDCIPCRKEIPELYKMATEEKLKASLLFIDPLGSDSPASIKTYADNLGVPASYFYHDSLGHLAKKFFKGQNKFPTIIGIKKNRIRFKVHDLSPESVTKIQETFK